MKAAKVFWGHLVLWTAGILAASFGLSWLLGTLPSGDYRSMPVLAALSVLDHRYVSYSPLQVDLADRLIFALLIGAYPAGVGAARLMDAPSRVWRFAAAGLLPAAVLAFLLVGYVRPDAVRADYPGLPASRQGPDYLYFHQVPQAFSALQAQADSAAAVRVPKLWALDRNLARSIVASRNHPFFDPTAGKALAFRNYIHSMLAQTALPAVLALIGLLVGLWSRTTPARFRRLQVWVGALVLVWLFYWELTSHQAYGGSWYWESWPPRDRAIVPPLLLLLPLAWTVFLARDRLFRPFAPMIGEPPAAGKQVEPETVGA